MKQPQTNTNTYLAPHYRGMTDEQSRLVHNASLEILERTGVLLYYQPAIDLLKKAGCQLDESRARLPPHLADRQNHQQWLADGATSMRERARAKIEEILAGEPQHVLPPEREKRVGKIADHAVAAQMK